MFRTVVGELMEWSLITGRGGGATKRERGGKGSFTPMKRRGGGQVKFYPYKMLGGGVGGKSFSMLNGGGGEVTW